MPTAALADPAVATSRWLWTAIGIFIISSSYLNFLDRQLLAAIGFTPLWVIVPVLPTLGLIRTQISVKRGAEPIASAVHA